MHSLPAAMQFWHLVLLPSLTPMDGQLPAVRRRWSLHLTLLFLHLTQAMVDRTCRTSALPVATRCAGICHSHHLFRSFLLRAKSERTASPSIRSPKVINFAVRQMMLRWCVRQWMLLRRKGFRVASLWTRRSYFSCFRGDRV